MCERCYLVAAPLREAQRYIRGFFSDVRALLLGPNVSKVRVVGLRHDVVVEYVVVATHRFRHNVTGRDIVDGKAGALEALRVGAEPRSNFARRNRTGAELGLHCVPEGLVKRARPRELSRAVRRSNGVRHDSRGRWRC